MSVREDHGWGVRGERGFPRSRTGTAGPDILLIAGAERTPDRIRWPELFDCDRDERVPR